MGEIISGTEKKLKPKKRKTIIFWISLVAGILLFSTLCSFASYKYIIQNRYNPQKELNYVIPPDKAIKVEIPIGSGTGKIAKILEQNGLINYPSIFKFMSYINGFDGSYRSGTHTLSKNLSYNDIMYILTGEPETLKIMIPEHYTLNQAADKLAEKGLVDKDKFLKLTDSMSFGYDFLKGIQRTDHKLEGYLFPDTYQFDAKAGEELIIKTMLNEFDNKFKPEYYKRAKELNMTVDQIIILASIIEREAKDPSERETIAGVFYNRLKSKDKTLNLLQSCATIQYIFQKKGLEPKETVSLEDEKIDDPYNTYKFAGLPPGPICSPGEASIKAALYPEKNDYYYFVVANDGTGGHIFSKTYKEHLNAVALSQKRAKNK